jgi:RNA polymerase sigma-70 factor (ECF subfamily)
MPGDSMPISLPLSRLASSASARAGEDDAEADTLYRELRRPLLRYLVCLGLSSDEAQDVVQDAFLSLHHHIAAGGSQENIRSWLFRVAHNQARNRQNRYDRRFTAPLEAGENLISDKATPERAVLDKEQFQEMAKAIRLLTASEQECVFLRAGGLRYREIGEVLSISTSTVSDTINRAIKKLAEKFK